MLKITERIKKGSLPVIAAFALVAFQPMTAVYATADTVNPETTTTNTQTDHAQTTPPPAEVKTETAPVPQEKEKTAEPAPAQQNTAAPQADDAPSPAPAPKTGPKKPNGADAKTYKQDEKTGEWKNDHYKWDAKNGQAVPTKEQPYVYNKKAGVWETEEHYWDAASGSYKERIVPVADLPEGANVQPSFHAQSDDHDDSNGSDHNDENGQNGSHDDDGSTGNVFLDFFNNIGLTNEIDSDATSGDVALGSNTSAGNATSGDARAISNVINLLQSSWGWTGDLMTFISDIYGDVVGDIMLNPGDMTDDAPVAGQNDPDYDIEVNAETNASINNDIDLTANSGNVDATSNTQTGDLTSGDASVLANVINLINSSIAADESFMGMINIHGNLDGDILLPPGVLEQMLASGGANTPDHNGGDLTINSDSNQEIRNNVSADADSGDISATSNTATGDLASGDAQTELTILNLTGKEVIGENALLVFVNVFGTWVGTIVNAPTGSTSAALGGGIESDTNTYAPTTGDITINEETNHRINNDIELDAGSGNVNADSNTEIGDATSGDAYAGANIANISNSQFNLSDWFGVLFINVFGGWTGDFGNDTEAGGQADENTGGNGSGTPAPAPSSNANDNKEQQAAPQLASAASGGSSNTPAATFATSSNPFVGFSSDAAPTIAAEEDRTLPSPIALTTGSDGGSAGGTAAPLEGESGSNANWLFSVVGMLIGLSLIGIERIMAMRNSRQRFSPAA